MTAPHSGPIGQYYLLDKIAQGGMAEIYKGLAYDLHGIKRTVVIKKILPHVAAHREFIDMLVTEAKLAVQLSHGNIAQVYDLGKVGEDYFMVMEYVDGKTLSQSVRKAAQMNLPMPFEWVAYVASEVTAGLAYMHSRTDANGRPLNIIHRDMSPQNVMVASDGMVKIIDFGIAKAASKIEVTDVGVVKGKFAYMSPEQARGDPLDHRSDIFSLGVILFEMITGRRLFKGKDNQETIRNVRRAQVPDPALYRHDTPAALTRIIMKALALRREERYASAADLRDDLVKFLHQFAPEFQQSAVGQYFQALYKDDRPDLEEDSKTPLLIIDRTQSAILSSLEQELPPAETSQTLERVDEEPSELTPLFVQPFFSKYLQRWVLVGAGLLSLVAIGAAGVYLQRHALPLPIPPQTVPIIPTEQPPPPFGDLYVESTPSGAAIYMDDRPLNMETPATISQLAAPSDHVIGLHLKGYVFWSSPFQIRPGGVERIGATLTPDYASLEVLSTPLGAEVWVNDKAVGKTPYHDETLLPGEVFHIKVALAGYRPWETHLKSAPGKLSTLRPILERLPPNERPLPPPPITPTPPVLPSVK